MSFLPAPLVAMGEAFMPAITTEAAAAAAAAETAAVAETAGAATAAAEAAGAAETTASTLAAPSAIDALTASLASATSAPASSSSLFLQPQPDIGALISNASTPAAFFPEADSVLSSVYPLTHNMAATPAAATGSSFSLGDALQGASLLKPQQAPAAAPAPGGHAQQLNDPATRQKLALQLAQQMAPPTLQKSPQGVAPGTSPQQYPQYPSLGSYL